MPTVRNWQLRREMDYPYDEAPPDRQFAFVFNTNRCIGCQTCTMACKSTWTFSRGQEHMWWNNVESKPFGGGPQSWGVKLPWVLVPRLPRRVPAECDLQETRGWHRPHRPVPLPRVSKVHRGVPVQEVNVAAKYAVEREVHRVLPAGRDGHRDPLRLCMRRKDPTPRMDRRPEVSRLLPCARGTGCAPVVSAVRHGAERVLHTAPVGSAAVPPPEG